MTLMVRDEADVIAAMLEHHLAQGVDLIIATDNGSVDGTREILAEYASHGVLELADHPTHDKNQRDIVTAMARRAAVDFGADWVLNADADEFFVPVDHSLSLREAFARISPTLGSFRASVVNLTGAPAKDGSGLRRLTWRDERTEEVLAAEAGLRSQPTANAIHVGAAKVTVKQGNHHVSIPSLGQPAPEVAIEVLHLPWRSFSQFDRKVRAAGLAYAGNPNISPSPRHHGLRDYRFAQAGILPDLYLLRHPDPAAYGSDSSLIFDDFLPRELEALLDAGTARCPELLSATLDDPTHPADYSDEDRALAKTVAAAALVIDHERTEALHQAVRENKAVRRALGRPDSLDVRVGSAVLAVPRAVARVAERLTGRTILTTRQERR